MNDEDNYDEFGNYIGPDIPEINESNKINEENEENEENDSELNIYKNDQNLNNNEMEIDTSINNPPTMFSNLKNTDYQVTLHEEKEYYPDAQQVFPGVETLVMEEDTQPISIPIIPPQVKQKYDYYENVQPKLTYELNFMLNLMTNQKLIRNICVLGALHHGKTSFLDMLINFTHLNNKYVKYLDNREDEINRKISIKAKPITLMLNNSKGKNYIFHFIDTPGHNNFLDEIMSSIRLCDGGLILVDICEGITYQTEKIMLECIKENIDIILVINKIDRLILELKLPPQDAYLKIKFIIDEFNRILIENNIYNNNKDGKINFVNPIKGNVIFCSSEYNIIFTLQSFCIEKYKNEKLSKFMFGDIFYDSDSNKFLKSQTHEKQKRTFVKFILKPIYKIISYTLTEEKEELEKLFKNIGIKNQIKNIDYKLDQKPLLKKITKTYFGNICSIIDVCVNFIRDSEIGSKIKLNNLYTGDKNDEIYIKLLECNKTSPLLIYITKYYHKPDHKIFDLYGRILSGKIIKNQNVKILGADYSLEDKENSLIKKISNIWINQTRYRIEIPMAEAGNLILLDGTDVPMSSNLTIIGTDNKQFNYENISILKPLHFNFAYMKVSIEPLNPSELPKMIEGLRKINKSYPASKTKVEESGENILIGTGELYMDNILYDLRNVYTEIEIKVSDPVVNFCETIMETSSFKCLGKSHNNKNNLTMIAEPLNKEIVNDINLDLINCLYKNDLNEIKSSYLINNLNWDKFTSNNIWAFSNSNMLINYTIQTENDNVSLNQMKNEIVQGFEWAIKEGPLINEPILNTKFKILSSEFASEPVFKASGQIIPMARRVCYSSFLLGMPRIMEPILYGEIHCTLESIESIINLLNLRRGHIESQYPLSGTPLYVMRYTIPALDSFGFETDIRTTTAGQAFCLMWFKNYEPMVGDPLDKTIQLHPLEPSSVTFLAREVLIKTRRRKGLNEDINIINFFNEDEVEKIKEYEEYKNYI